MNTDELHELIEAAIEGRLTADQAARLEQAVLTDPAARRFYAEYAALHAGLHWPAVHPAVEPTPPRRGVVGRLAGRRGLAGMALAAGVLLTVWLIAGREPRPVATLTEAKACRWNGGRLPTEVGAELRPGRLRLAEGLARVRFASGAEVTLEGPADLELVTDMRCVLHDGRLVARVPPEASGFVVETPSSVLTDFGTEFGVSVRDGRSADVNVFTGRVDATHRATGRTREMHAGTLLRFLPDGVVPFRPEVEDPSSGATDRLPAGTRRVQVSTALGRGRDTFVMPLEEVPPDRQTDTLLLVKRTVPKESQWDRKVYMGLDLAVLTRTAILDAEFTLTFTPTGMGFAARVPDATFVVYGLTDESLDDWDERAVRWATAPANRPGGDALDPDKVVKLGTFVLAQGEQSGTRSVGGPALVEFLKRDTNQLVTFILVRETPGKGGSDLVHGVASRRHPTLSPPTLRLTVADGRN
jgi:hypothetical protein